MSSAASSSKVAAELGRGQRMHDLAQRPPREQVDAGRLELARARSEQGEPEPPVLDEAVHLVEEIGQALDLVDDDPVARGNRLELRREERRIDEVVLVPPLVQEVDAKRIRELPPSPRALAGAAHPKEEEALPGRPGQPRVGYIGHHAVKFRRNLTAWCHTRRPPATNSHGMHLSGSTGPEGRSVPLSPVAGRCAHLRRLVRTAIVARLGTFDKTQGVLMASVTVHTLDEDSMTCLPGHRARDLPRGLPDRGT